MIQILSGTNQHTFYTYDANYNVTAALDRDGNVVERYTYTPYGERTVIDDDWSSDGDGLSDISSNFGHQGGVIDVESGLMKFRHRDYHISIGGWAQRDPLGYHDGLNLFQSYQGNSLIKIDPYGTISTLAGVAIVGGVAAMMAAFFYLHFSQSLLTSTPAPKPNSSAATDCCPNGTGKQKPSSFAVECTDMGLGSKHCWVAIKDANGTVIGTISGRPQKNGGPGSLFYPWRDNGILTYDPDSDMKTKVDASVLVTRGGSSPCVFARCLDRAAKLFHDKAIPYAPIGGQNAIGRYADETANSNTLVSEAIRSCGGLVSMPPGAYRGFDVTPQNTNAKYY